jgi:hypothetical protein
MTVSVVIAGVSGERVVSHCVASIRRIATGEDIEIIVLEGAPSSVFRFRAQGIEQATGDRIAVLGDRYEVTPTWLRALRQNCDSAVTGGCVAPGPRLDYWGWCVYLCEYAHISPPVAEGATQQPKLVPGGNVVYSHAIVRRFPPARAKSDLSFHASLIGAAVSVGICPDLEVRFASPPGFSEYVQERFRYSRLIGAEGGIRKAPIALLLPLVMPLRTAAAVVRKRRYRLRFLACLPAIATLGFVQAVGEFAGALSTLARRSPSDL